MSPCDPVLGALTRLDDRSLSATIGFARQQIPVRIDPDGDPAEGTLANARALAETISEMDRRTRQSAAADLLNEPEETLDTIAERVGYSSAFSLSSAFKRVRGISPKEHRIRSIALNAGVHVNPIKR